MRRLGWTSHRFLLGRSFFLLVLCLSLSLLCVSLPHSSYSYDIPRDITLDILERPTRQQRNEINASHMQETRIPSKYQNNRSEPIRSDPIRPAASYVPTLPYHARGHNPISPYLTSLKKKKVLSQTPYLSPPSAFFLASRFNPFLLLLLRDLTTGTPGWLN